MTLHSDTYEKGFALSQVVASMPDPTPNEAPQKPPLPPEFDGSDYIHLEGIDQYIKVPESVMEDIR